MKTKLGKSGLVVDKDGFGCLPLQRADMGTATALLRGAYEAGINFFDTARAYTDSEEKVGAALAPVRGHVLIATKTMAADGDTARKELEESLRRLKTDYVDLYQFHNPAFCPQPGDGSGLYEMALQAKKEGKIRHIGITNHRLPVAKQAVESGLYDTLQYQFNYLADEKDEALVRLCAEKDVGLIAMKALGGGLLTDIGTCRAWLAQFENVVPVWGMQRQSELDALVAARGGPDALTPEQKARIAADRAELVGNFCRGCGYCLPCPAEIRINFCARMTPLLRRAPMDDYLGEGWQAEMAKIDECLECGQCSSRCPYGLDTPALLRKNYAEYKEILAQSQAEQDAQ